MPLGVYEKQLLDNIGKSLLDLKFIVWHDQIYWQEQLHDQI